MYLRYSEKAIARIYIRFAVFEDYFHFKLLLEPLLISFKFEQFLILAFDYSKIHILLVDQTIAYSQFKHHAYFRVLLFVLFCHRPRHLHHRYCQLLPDRVV